MGASVVACVDAPPVLEYSKHVLDLVALFIERFIVHDLCFVVLFQWYARCDAFGFQSVPGPVDIIAAIRE